VHNNIKSLSQFNFLLEVTFCHDFNQKLQVGFFPDSVLVIRFGCYFNKKIEPNVLPKNLRVLIFGAKFNKCIKQNTLPRTLKKLVLRRDFNKKIEIGLGEIKVRLMIKVMYIYLETN
jgi:hypothetical protein